MVAAGHQQSSKSARNSNSKLPAAPASAPNHPSRSNINNTVHSSCIGNIKSNQMPHQSNTVQDHNSISSSNNQFADSNSTHSNPKFDKDFGKRSNSSLNKQTESLQHFNNMDSASGNRSISMNHHVPPINQSIGMFEEMLDMSPTSSEAANMYRIDRGRWYNPNDYSAVLRASKNVSGKSQATAGVFDSDQELYLRQKAALQAQIFGNRLRLKQICINTAIVCIHRMFMIHDIAKFNTNAFVVSSLFLAAKVEEVPIGLESCAQLVLAANNRMPHFPHPKSPECEVLKQEIVALENAILHTLAFDLEILHPHFMILNYCNKMKLPKEITKLSYTLGTYILILSNLCVRYKPSCLACVCINLAYKCVRSFSADLKNPGKEEGEMDDETESSIVDILETDDWVKIYEPSLDKNLLEGLTLEFFKAIHRTPNELKKTLVNHTFNKNEPEYNQIVELMLNHSSRKNVANLFHTNNDPELLGTPSKKPMMQKDESEYKKSTILAQTQININPNNDNNKSANNNTKTFLTKEEFDIFDKKMSSFLAIQKSNILQHNVKNNPGGFAAAAL